MTVMRMNHMNGGVWYCDSTGDFMLITIVMQSIAPRTEDMPAR